MASRPKGYGLTAEVANKIASKYDPELEQQARQWMVDVVGEPLVPSEPGSANFHEALKDGTYLCKLMNQIQPGAIKKINQSKMAFKQMENIGHFLSACEGYGMSKVDLFQTVDLYEAQNMPSVVNGIHALGRKAQSKGYAGPTLGPREANRNVREFSEETLAAGKTVIGLQAGSNKGASQAGMSMGQARHINDIKTGEMSQEGKTEIGLQMGSNKGASQAGQSFGKTRQIVD